MQKPPSPLSNLEQQRRIFGERVRSLLEDGYHVIATVDNDLFLFASLRHNNGNRVVIKGYPKSNAMTQFSNNRMVYDGVIL